MTTHLRLYNANLIPLGFLPDYQNLVVQYALNDTGTLTFDYPQVGKNQELLDTGVAWIEVVEKGVPSPDLFLLEDDGENLDQQGFNAPWTVSCRGVLAMLEWAVIYPELHTPGGPVNLLYPQNRFISQTPGAIVQTLLQRAQARGALMSPRLTWDFTDTHDSAGQPWPITYTHQYDSGMDYLTVVKGMADNGWADIRTHGFTLQMFAPGTALKVDRPNVVLRKGQSVMEGPVRKRTRRNIRTTILGVGADRVLAESVNTGAQALWGRREGSANDGRAISYGAMQYATDAALAEKIAAAEGITVKYLLDQTGERWHVPGVDFNVGDLIRYDQRRTDSQTFEPLRVRTITYGFDTGSSDKTCTLELNDRFTEQALALKQRVDTLMNGISLAPLTNAPPVPLPPVTPPAYPAGVLALLGVVDGPGGIRTASANVQWQAVAVKADGLPYNDASYYAIAYKQGTTADSTGSWSPEQQVPASQTSTTLSNLVPGKPYVFRVAAVDLAGNRSPWGYSIIQTAPVDNVPPQQTSVPTVQATGFGTLRVSWDGFNAAAGPMDPDLDHVDVYVNTSSTFTGATRYDSLGTAAGVSIYAAPNLTTTFYFFLVAVDKTGNHSPPSAASAGIIATGVTQGLVGQGVLGYTNFAFSDAGNLIGDGSFEQQSTRDSYTLPNGTQWVQDSTNAYLGNWMLRWNPGSHQLRIVKVDCKPGDEFFLRRAAKGSTGTNGVFDVHIRWFDKSGAQLTDTPIITTPPGDGSWHGQFTGPGDIVAPANAASLEVWQSSDGTFTTGTWDSDGFELRLKAGTELIRNASITTALIADLAVTDAQVNNMSVGKLIAGKLSADVGLAGRLLIGPLNPDGTLVSPTKKRVEITSNGLVQYDDNNNPLVTIGPAGSTFSGTVTAALFQTRTDATKARMVIDPAGLESSNGNSAITCYPPPSVAGAPIDPGYIGFDTLSTNTGGVYHNTCMLYLQSGSNGQGSGFLQVMPYQDQGGTTYPYMGGSSVHLGTHLWVNAGYVRTKAVAGTDASGGGALIARGSSTTTPDLISFQWDASTGHVLVYVNGQNHGQIN